MSKTDNLQLEIPSAADKHIFTTYKNNNEIIDEAYGQYLEDQETSQENIAMIESSTAQSNHAVGSYFMLDNVLHKATSAIASGETITPGSNATPITIEEALTALNTSVNSLRDSVYVSLSLTNVANGFLALQKVGKMVMVNFGNVITASSVTKRTVIGNLPDGFVPAEECYAFATRIINGVPCYLMFTSSGEVKVDPCQSSLWGSGCYLAQ